MLFELLLLSRQLSHIDFGAIFRKCDLTKVKIP